jgi:hypothetical protein
MLAASACTPPGGSEGDETGTTETGDGDGDGDGDLSDCTIEPGDHSQVCEGSDCPIIVDVELRCPPGPHHDGFGEYGLAIAPAPNATWLASVSDQGPWLAEIVGDTAELHELPSALGESRPLLAQDELGGVHAIWQAFKELLYVRAEPPFETELVAASDWGPIDFELGPDDQPHAWFSSGHALMPQHHAARVGDGEWTVEDALHVDSEDQLEDERYGFDANGELTHTRYLPDGEQNSIYGLVGGELRQLADPVDNLPAYLLAHAPKPAMTVDGPALVLLQHPYNGELTLGWTTDDGYERLNLADTFGITTLCPEPSGPGPDCGEPCHETGSGISLEGWTIARASDGVVWIAYLVDRYDYWTEPGPGPIIDDQPSDCQDNATRVWTSELQLLRFVPGEAPEQVLTMDVAQSDVEAIGGYGIDARVYADQLAIAARFADDEGRLIRAWRIDLAKL